MPAVATRGDALGITWSGIDRGDPKAVGAIPGTAVTWAAGLNGEGIAALGSYNDGKDIAFRAPGSQTFGEPVRCDSDGNYLLEDGEDRNKWVRLAVRTAFLSPSPQQARAFFNHQAGFMVMDKSPSTTTNLILSLKNRAAYKLENVFVWSPTAGITFNPFGGGDTAAPDEVSAISMGSFNPGQSKALTCKLTTGASASPRELVDIRAKWSAF